MSQVSKRSEVVYIDGAPSTPGYLLALLRELSQCPTGPYRNCRGEAGTKNEPDTFFVPVQKKGWKIDPHVSNILADFFFRGFRSTLKRESIEWLRFVGSIKS